MLPIVVRLQATNLFIMNIKLYISKTHYENENITIRILYKNII